jgi:DNA-binding Lrp family transcriptional regulator
MTGLLNKFLTSLKNRSDLKEVKSFKESQKNEEAFDTVDRGICSVPLNRIVGSVGRYHDFDGKFRLKQYVPSDRLQNIRKAMREGKPLPRIKLFKIKDEYYVLDGNHRVSAAKEFGYQDIDANIVEFIPSKNTLENILYREKSEFNDKTWLPYSIELTEVGQYAHLIKQILKHQDFLKQTAEDSVSFENATLDWYETIYCPLTAIIEKAQLIESFPNRKIEDLYTYITFHQWERRSVRKYGSGVNQLISENMEDFRKKMSNKKEFEYPEMRREITAFILMNISAGKKGDRIIEKLYALEEVREVHSVHGNVDILAKIVLTRDLISSDAETIWDFVNNKVGQITGIVSTQTLIPGFSKVKANQTEGR